MGTLRDLSAPVSGYWPMRLVTVPSQHTKVMEERKRILYVVFILSSLLVSANNRTPALTNSDIQLDLPCDEEFFADGNSFSFNANGGVAAANHNRMRFREALGKLLRLNSSQHQVPFGNSPQDVGSAAHADDLPNSDLKPSTFGCLILTIALHKLHLGNLCSSSSTHCRGFKMHG